MKSFKNLFNKISFTHTSSKLTLLTFFLFICQDFYAEDLKPPPAYSLEKALTVYGEAFEKAVEFTKMNQINGPILEFGTLEGFTATILANLMNKYQLDTKLHLFDSFEGLPTITSSVDLSSYEVKDYKVWEKGSMKVESNVPETIEKRISKIIPSTQLTIHKGFYSTTFQEGTIDTPPAIVHIDCDLYQSAKEVLSTLFSQNLVQDGLVILFDDYNCSRANPNFGERKAFKEILEEYTNYSSSLFYYYGWHGAAFLIHKN